MKNLPYTKAGLPETANFKLAEMHSKDGVPVPKEFYGNVQALFEELQNLRDSLGMPIRINSGYRSPAHNTKIGGAKGSQHLFGRAVDIVAIGFTADQLYAKIRAMQLNGELKKGGVGLYGSWVHYDIGPERYWKG